jgi:hypothetical protein
MRLDCLLVADAAAALEGKLYIHGGGITRVTPPMFPWAQPMAFCIRLLPDEDDDLGVARKLALRMTDPGGNSMLAGGEFTMPPIDETVWLAGEERSVEISVTVSNVVFPEPGLFELELLIDGVRLKHLTLPVILAEPAVLPPPQIP